MSNRLTSAIFVAAVIRNVNSAGGFATVLRHGSDEAGAIFICVPAGPGAGTTLYAQAPQSMFTDNDRPFVGGRLFERVGEGLADDELAEKFAREARMDPDFWVVELDLFGKQASDYFDIA
ncbi:DUF1491 family protein [Oricola indica]|uniref:DUF1491 family protein n=1 Tax=Oricola indica TaxID=2872591 RepID=UPI003CCBE7B8